MEVRDGRAEVMPLLWIVKTEEAELNPRLKPRNLAHHRQQELGKPRKYYAPVPTQLGPFISGGHVR
jgi:hypothetical protein